MTARRALALAALLLWTGARCGADDAERIVDFASHVEVRSDGSLAVTEKIAVVAAGDEIKHGIFRDFPTRYDGAYGTRVEVPFWITGMQRDGRREPYHTETVERGVRVYAGRKDELVAPGPHVYELSYETKEQLGFFADHDELYWNVTGNGWAFPIERAAAAVTLPAGVPRSSIRLEGYTGPRSSRATALRHWVDDQGVLHFETTQALDAYEGLTIVASFAKGFVREPSAEERRARFLRDNRMIVVGAAGLVVVLLYYAIAWMLVGRDPARGTIIPLFEPPLGLGPACLRYVRGMGYDQRCFAAALVDMAVKGWLRIEEKDGDYTLVKNAKKDVPLSLGEKQIAAQLLSSGSLKLESANHRKVKGAIRALRDSLALEYDGKLFRANWKWFVAGVVLSVLCVLTAGLSGRVEQAFSFLFMTVWLSGWSVGTFVVAGTALRLWASVFVPASSAFARVGAVVSAVFASLFAVPMLGGEAFGLFALTQATTFWMAPILIVLAGAAVLFLELLKRPTLAGRKLMDQIDGFKMYLETAEGAELARMAGPAKTPQLFEKMLPYAIALGVENAWAEKFAGVLAAAGSDDASGTYRPLWYSGNSWQRLGAQTFVGSFGSSLSGAVATSSTAPGSSSGSGGGGSSGGGGGGGGGGGW